MTTEISLKPGSQSTEFLGKVTLQVILVINIILQTCKLPAIEVSPEMSVAIAGGIEALWLMFRQFNKKKELEMKQAVATTEVSDGLKKALGKASSLEASHIAMSTKISQNNQLMTDLKAELTKPGR